MCADLVMRKRPAMHAGEMGLFIDTQVFEEEFAAIKQNTDVTVTATQSRNIKQMRLAWALCRKIADSGALGDCDTRDVMNYLLLKAKHVRYVTNVHREGTEITPIVKSIRFASMDQTAFDRLFNRLVFIVTSDVLPDVPDGVLREEIEKMAGIEAPTPEQKPVRQRRRAAATPEKVSVIPPDHDPVTGEVIESPTDAAPPAPAASATSAPPAPAAKEKAAPTPIKAPTTVQGWKDHCKAWLDAIHEDDTKTDVDVLTKWTGETKLRNSCGVTAEERAQLFAYMNAIVEAKREAQAKRI